MTHALADWLCRQLGLDPLIWHDWLWLILQILLAAVLFFSFISLYAMFAIWLERKVAGHIQSRLGPMHVGGWHGWAQSIADGVKLLFKELLIPAGADRFLFRIAPYLAFVPVFLAFLALPFAPQLIFEDRLNIALLYILGVLSVDVVGVILAGWASNNKWSLYGGMRQACQMVSYEVPLGLALLSGVLVAGTLNMAELSYLQGGGLQDWLVFHNPFVAAACLIFFVAALASNKRSPFDLPESESELTAGFHTEYSGMRLAMFFFAEYAAMLVVGAILATLFLGGWNSPLGPIDPIYLLLGYDPIAAGQAYFAGQLTSAADWPSAARTLGLSTTALVLLNLYGLFWFLGKALGIVFLQIWLRWTLPRVRIDQVLHMCVKVLLPLSLVCLVGTGLWLWLVPQPAPVRINGQSIARLGHLVSSTPFLQLLTQILLTVLGLSLKLACVLIVLLAWRRGRRETARSLFSDIMPFGPDATFTASYPK